MNEKEPPGALAPANAGMGFIAPITPMAMLSTAMAQGASIETLRELMLLKREHETAEARKAYYAAMADAAPELPQITKSKLVDFTSQKGRTRYRYEALDDVVSAVRPVLGKHGLNHTWTVEERDDRLVVTCRITHRDGHSETCTLSAPRDESGQKNLIQSKGSAITYLQRYTLKAALGLAAAEDDDAQATTPGKLTPEQVAQITALAKDIEDKGVLDRVKAQLQVAEISDIPANRFEVVIKRLRATKLAEGQPQGATP